MEHFLGRMFHTPEDFSTSVPTLPEGVAECDGIPRAKWNTMPVIIRNDAGNDVANAICLNVDPELIIDTDGEPLGDDRVAVQIAESLCEEEVPSS